MGFKAGHKKVGGRKKGTPNEKTRDFIAAKGDFDTIEHLKELYNSTEKEDIKFQILKLFAEFEYPKRKAVEMSGDMEFNNNPLEVKLI